MIFKMYGCGCINWSLTSNGPDLHVHCSCSVSRKGTGPDVISLGGKLKLYKMKNKYDILGFHIFIKSGKFWSVLLFSSSKNFTEILWDFLYSGFILLPFHSYFKKTFYNIKFFSYFLVTCGNYKFRI